VNEDFLKQPVIEAAVVVVVVVVVLVAEKLSSVEVRWRRVTRGPRCWL